MIIKFIKHNKGKKSKVKTQNKCKKKVEKSTRARIIKRMGKKERCSTCTCTISL